MSEKRSDRRPNKSKYSGEEQLTQLAGLLPAGFDIHQAARILADYLEGLEETFNNSQKKAQNDRRAFEAQMRAQTKQLLDQKQEVNRLTADLLDVTNTMEEQESALGASNQKLVSAEKQIKKLQRTHNELANKLTQRENDADFFRQELERTKHELETANTSLAAVTAQLDEAEQLLSSEREKIKSFEKETRHLKLALDESQGKVTLVENRLEAVVVKYSDEIKRLSARSNADAQHEAAALKKHLSAILLPEANEFYRLKSTKLNPETAKRFRAVLGRLISKLERVGFQFK